IMAIYPPNEIVDMIRILSDARNNYSGAERLYAEKFPDRRHPDRKVIKRLCDRAELFLEETNRRKSGPDEVTSLTIIGTVALNPQISTRQIERQHGVSKSTASVLKFNKFHPYHIHL
ncbi:hypothetical protein EAG_05468, partial [Camponotus floridanus]